MELDAEVEVFVGIGDMSFPLQVRRVCCSVTHTVHGIFSEALDARTETCRELRKERLFPLLHLALSQIDLFQSLLEAMVILERRMDVALQERIWEKVFPGEEREGSRVRLRLILYIRLWQCHLLLRCQFRSLATPERNAREEEDGGSGYLRSIHLDFLSLQLRL